MKGKTLLMLALAMVLAAASNASTVATAAGAEVPFKATYMMHPKPVGEINSCIIQELPGEGNATHLGLSTFYSDAIACTDTLTQAGDMLFTAANGDQLFGGFAGSIAFSPDFLSVDFWGYYWITGGTGRFEGVTGGGTYWGTAKLGLVGGDEGILYLDGVLNK